MSTTKSRLRLQWALTIVGLLATPVLAQYSNVPPSYPNQVPMQPQAANPNFPQNNFGPAAPESPGAAGRPASWPGGPQDPARMQAPQYGAPQQGVPPQGMQPYGAPMQSMSTGSMAGLAPAVPRRNPAEPPYDPELILARVGATEVVQYSEISPLVKKQLVEIEKQYADELSRMTPEQRRDNLLPAEKMVTRSAVNEMVRLKLLLAEVRSTAPAEGWKKNETNFRKSFNEEYLKRLMKEYNATSTVDLDQKLRAVGSSIDAQRTLFIEQTFAFGWLKAQSKVDAEASHEQLLTYYREHATDWDTPAKARWEHLMLKYMSFESKAAARAAMAQLGNDVLRGVPWAEVAKARSQDYTASQGGLHDWTVQASLKSDVIDRALFSLPVGAPSQILEDEDGVHIVRVVERVDARRAPFVEVQDDIREKIANVKRQKNEMEYVEKLREKITVWTIFDEDDAAVAKQPGGTRR